MREFGEAGVLRRKDATRVSQVLRKGLLRRRREIDLQRVDKRDVVRLFFPEAVDASLHAEVELFCLFGRVAVLEDADVGLLGRPNIFAFDLSYDVDDVFVDFRQDAVFVDGLGGPEDLAPFVV